jgi:M6 family metalloprotease-like protein
MGEGFGDYWGMSMYSTETVANGHPLGCVGEWDATSYSSTTPPCLRRVDDNVTMSDYDATADEHDNAHVWSRVLFDIFNQLGKTTADRLVLQSHFNVPASGPSLKDAVDAIMTADLQLFQGSHLAALCQIFIDRKFYQASDCPELPPATGTQDTLVLLINFDETGLTKDPVGVASVNTILNGVSAYVKEVGYNQVTLSPTVKGWYTVPHDRAHYYDKTAANVLIELVGDALSQLAAAEPSFDFSGIDRILVITNDDGSGGVTGGDREYATTGPWPYALPAALGTRRMSASVNRYKDAAAQFDHVMGHHFGMVDLYPHEGVTFPRKYMDGWDNMALTNGGFNDAHFTTWEKLRPGWLDAAADVAFRARPPADPDPAHHLTETIPLHAQETNTAATEVIQIGTSNGVADRAHERVSYYVEARKKAGSYDSNVPSNGVLIYYVNEDIAQGFGPVRLVDRTPGDDDLTNAALGIGDSVADIDGTGLTISIEAPQGSEDYRVKMDYDPPETDVDVWINPHDGNWRSEDIWVDSPSCNQGNCGFDKDNGRTEVDRGDKPKPGQINRLYARIRNKGPGTAHNVRVDFWLSEPYHAIDGTDTDPDTGGNIAFNKHYFTVINDLPMGDLPVYVEWKPDPLPPGQTQPHTCVKVKIQKVFNDTDDLNQASQENIDEYDTTSGSPYTPVVNQFRVVNPYDHPILVYLRADDVPVGWTADVTPKKAWLAVGASVDASVTIQPPLDYLVCSTEFVKVTAWYPSGDTLLRLGGTAARVNLKKRVQLDTQSTVGPCPRKPAVEVRSAEGRCVAIGERGCTQPPQPFEHITLEYTDPNGDPVYHDVVTEANGCFEDFLVNAQPGAWSAQAEYLGTECAAQAASRPSDVNVPPTDQGMLAACKCCDLWLIAVVVLVLLVLIFIILLRTKVLPVQVSVGILAALGVLIVAWMRYCRG